MGRFAHALFNTWRKIAVAAAVFALFAAAAFAMWSVRTKPHTAGHTSASGQQGEELNRKAIATANVDGDKDGLKDWEEAIWRTNPEKADTDGDGAPDGSEVAQNRDPLKPAPDDGLDATAAPDNSGDEAAADNITISLTKALLSSGVLDAIDEKGNVTSTDFLERLSLPQNLTSDRILDGAEKISAGDIRVLQTDAADAVRGYFTAVTAAYHRHIDQKQKGDILILTEALRDEDYGRLAEIEPHIISLTRLIRDIRGLGVPRAYVGIAVKELNYLIETKKALEIIRNAKADPLAAMIILPRRIALLSEMAQFHIEVSRELHEKKVFTNP